MPNDQLQRSSELVGREISSLIVIDVQAKLIPAISSSERLVWNIGRLLRAATLFDVPTFVTEQYPQGLGVTVEPLKSLSPAPIEKTRFSCGQCEPIETALRDQGRFQVVLAGIESHVCVLQSALDLSGLGFRVFVVEDAVSSRAPESHRLAMQRLAAAGVTLMSTESTLFEWCEDASDPQFKAISKLGREEGPSTP